MDFYTIGSNGFAQFGDVNYRAKAKIEMNVLMNFLYQQHPIPDLFNEFAWYRYKKFPYELDYYYEVVLEFDDHELDERCKAHPELSQLFHDWFSEVECAELESEELTELIERLYNKSLNRDKAEHLRIIRKVS